MGELIKIRDVSLQYGISARALKYYEEMELITSTRSDAYAYRLYDDAAVQQLEQILILRKLNISIKEVLCCRGGLKETLLKQHGSRPSVAILARLLAA